MLKLVGQENLYLWHVRASQSIRLLRSLPSGVGRDRAHRHPASELAL